jgi:hypothetical protein
MAGPNPALSLLFSLLPGNLRGVRDGVGSDAVGSFSSGIADIFKSGSSAISSVKLAEVEVQVGVLIFPSYADLFPSYADLIPSYVELLFARRHGNLPYKLLNLLRTAGANRENSQYFPIELGNLNGFCAARDSLPTPDEAR